MATSDAGPVDVLLVEGDDERRGRMVAWLEAADRAYEVGDVAGVAAAREALRTDDVDCIVSGHRLPDGDGLSLLGDVRRGYGDLPFVFVPAAGSEALASRAVQAGVTEYVPGLPVEERRDRLVGCVERALERYHSREPVVDVGGTSRALFDALNDPAFLHDPDGSFLAVNEAACELFGYSEAELLSMGPADIAAPGHGRRHADHLAELRLNDTLRFDTVLQRADGTEIPVEVNARRLDYYGEPAILSTARDVSERRRRERELRGFRQAVENAGHAIYITDREGTIEYVNRAFEEMTGYAGEEAIGRNPRILKSGEHDEAFYAALWDTITAGEVWEGEVVNRRADGERFVVDQTIAPVADEDGDIERFVAITTEVTERKARERELRRTNERLEEFASVVSHDLRNPLGVARGRVQLAMDDCDSPHLADADDALGRMDDLVDDVLALAREGAEDVAPEPVAVADLARRCWGNVATDGAELVVEDPPRIAADPSRLQQLLENLFRNAVTHAADGGATDPAVTIRVGGIGPAQRDGAHADDRADPGGFYVADDGPGIPAEERDAVFEHGYSSDDDGTGFGLSIVEAIAAAHGWEVALTESADGGARFVVRGVDGA